VVPIPSQFSAAASGPVRGVPEPGEHTDDILRDWTPRGRLPGHPACPAPTPRHACHVMPRHPMPPRATSRHETPALPLESHQPLAAQEPGLVGPQPPPGQVNGMRLR
jgi:hypothetical protein